MAEETQKNLNALFKGASFIILGLVISKLLGFVYRIIIARYDVENYGLFILALTVYSLTLTISLAGYPNGLVKFISQYISKDDVASERKISISGLKFVLILSVIASLLVFMFADQIAIKYFHNQELKNFLK